MDDLLQEIDRRCILIGSLISSCCVWKRTEFCLTERNLQYSYMHKHPFCDQVKQQCGLSICQKNDTDLLIRKLPLYNNHRFTVPAGSSAAYCAGHSELPARRTRY